MEISERRKWQDRATAIRRLRRFVRTDFNLDGKTELVAVNRDSNNVSVFPGNGSGGFGVITNILVGFSPRSVAVGDFNKDGKPDLAVANANSNDVTILLNTSK